MRILFAVRDDLHDWPGGDTVQITSTAAALQNRGIEVTVASDFRADLSEFDCVHLWHLERVHETYVHLQNALRFGKPVALSPIYWPPDGCPRPARTLSSSRARSWREELKNVVRLFLAGSNVQRGAVGAALKAGWACARAEILDHASVILSNSSAEAEIIAAECPRNPRIVVVPNGVDPAACRRAADAAADGKRTGVLCVGHFDVRKNQLGLIEALDGTDVRVSFVGEGRRMHRRYFRRCRRLARNRHTFLCSQSHEQVLRLMRHARLHVCPSRFETPGLSNLEAAAMGCNLVLPDCPPVREYFLDEANYFDVSDTSSLRSAVLRAMEDDPGPELAARILSSYTWEIAAEKTLAAYRKIIESCAVKANPASRSRRTDF